MVSYWMSLKFWKIRRPTIKEYYTVENKSLTFNVLNKIGWLLNCINRSGGVYWLKYLSGYLGSLNDFL